VSTVSRSCAGCPTRSRRKEGSVLSQAEADALIAEKKRFEQPTLIRLLAGADSTFILIGESGESFLLDTWRGTIRMSKVKFQNRTRKAFVLLRLDINGAPHTNPEPDGTRLRGTHLHVYREGYEDKWATELDPARFVDTSDIGRTLQDFFTVCGIDPQNAVIEVGAL
jgi:hypothetical protein